MAATGPGLKPPAAPPVFRPERTPKVLQLRSAHPSVFGTANNDQLVARTAALRVTAHSKSTQLALPSMALANRSHSGSGVVQRVIIDTGTETIDTKTKTVFELTQIAQRLVSVNKENPAAKAIYKAIEEEDVLVENDEDDDDDDEHAHSVVDVSDLVAMVSNEEPDEVDVPSADLLSRGEIIKLHKSAGHLDAKGFRSDNLTFAIGAAKTENSIAYKMARLVWDIVNFHTFNDGNKRTGELMLIAMMKKNREAIHWHGLDVLLQKAATKGAISQSDFKEGIKDLLTPPPKDWNPMGHAIL